MNNEHHARSPHDVYLAIMDRLGVKLVLLDDIDINYGEIK